MVLVIVLFVGEAKLLAIVGHQSLRQIALLGNIKPALRWNGIDGPVSLLEVRNVRNRPIEMVRCDVDAGALQEAECARHQVKCGG